MAKGKKKQEIQDYKVQLRALRQQGPGCLYLLWGREDYLREQYLLQLKKLCIPGGEDDFSYRRFDGAELDFQALADAIDAVPFLSERTLVEVRGYDTNKCREEEADTLVRVISDLPDYCTLVFVMGTDFEPDGRLKTTKAFKKYGQLIQFTAQGEAALEKWVGKRFKAHGKNISSEDARQLIFFTGGLMNTMIPEIDKIAAYAQGDTVTRADILAVAQRIPEAVVYELTDCLANQDYDGAMRINQPLVVEGEALSQTDSRGCLIQAGFAEVHGLSVGDRVSVKLSGQEYGFVVRGVVYSPEFICVTDGVYPNPDQYGYILINTCGMPDLPMTQVLVKLADGVDAQQAEKAITAALPAALVVNRGAHQSTANAQSNADMFANLTLVFPLIAYAVAALIVMTTLTRMIENQRMQLGTLKALGYPSRRIRGHYLSYAVWPSLIGSLLGVVAGHALLPNVIWALLLGQNEYPYKLYPAISGEAWAMVALTVVMSVLICLYTYQKSARETTADLLRPKPPKAGRRILLERVGFLWRRFNFNTKMIVRNLMRNRMHRHVLCGRTVLQRADHRLSGTAGFGQCAGRKPLHQGPVL